MKKPIVCSMNKTCVYCGNHSFGEWHVECIRLFTYLSTKGFRKQKITEIIKKKWDQSIKFLYPELKTEENEEKSDETKDLLIELETVE